MGEGAAASPVPAAAGFAPWAAFGDAPAVPSPQQQQQQQHPGTFGGHNPNPPAAQAGFANFPLAPGGADSGGGNADGNNGARPPPPQPPSWPTAVSSGFSLTGPPQGQGQQHGMQQPQNGASRTSGIFEAAPGGAVGSPAMSSGMPGLNASPSTGGLLQHQQQPQEQQQQHVAGFFPSPRNSQGVCIG